MRNKKWAALGAALVGVKVWRWHNESLDVVVEEVQPPAPILAPNPDPAFPWHHFTWEYKIPEHWVAEAIARREKPYELKVPGPTASIRVPPPAPPEKGIDIALPGLRPRAKVKIEEPVERPFVKVEKPKVELLSANDWPKNHIAFSSIPGIGRPLPDGGVLNSFWEAPPEEKAFREARREWWEKINKLRGKIAIVGVAPLDLRHIETGQLAFSSVLLDLDRQQKALDAAKKAAKELEPLIGSAPKHPSQQ